MIKVIKYISLLLSIVIAVGAVNITALATETTPFKNLTIPGTINLIDFDNGGPGVAFSETVTELLNIYLSLDR